MNEEFDVRQETLGQMYENLKTLGPGSVAYLNQMKAIEMLEGDLLKEAEIQAKIEVDYARKEADLFNRKFDIGTKIAGVAISLTSLIVSTIMMGKVFKMDSSNEIPTSILKNQALNNIGNGLKIKTF